MKIAADKFVKAFLSLLYPPICLHCKAGLQNNFNLLCGPCLALLQLIDPVERCPRCFSPHDQIEKVLCRDCLRKPPLLNGSAAAFDYAGPAASLIQKLKYSGQSYLAKGCGAYLAAQFLQLEWPMPDAIVPVPIALTHWFERGYNQSHLLAESLSVILDRPVRDALYRKSGDYSQAGLSRKQRQELEKGSFHCKSDMDLQDKCVLLVDDVMTTGSTIKRCAEALMEKCPSKIYGLCVCKAIDV